MTERDIDRRIAAIKRELLALGPLRRGSLTRQFNVCSNPTCRCKADPAHSHGPYYQFSYTHQGKSTSQFVREPDLPQLQEQVRNYERLRALVEGMGRPRHRTRAAPAHRPTNDIHSQNLRPTPI